MKVLRNKGQLASVPNQMIMLLIVVVVGIITIKVFGQLDENLRDGMSSEGAAAAGNFSEGTYDGFQTLSITPYIAVAVVIIGLVSTLLVMRM